MSAPAESNTQARVQVSIDPSVKLTAENVIREVGLTPTVVINSLYRKIAATGKIPLDFSLTPDQMADLELQTAIQKIPVKKLRTKKRSRTFSTMKSNEIYTAFITWPGGGK